MKVDRRNPRHWFWLALSAAWTLAAVVLRPLRALRRHRDGGPTVVLLYGHKLGGNLLALYRGLRADAGFDVAFLALDPAYRDQLAAQGEAAVAATSWRCLPWLLRADALVSDHGLHALEPLLHCSDLRFFDTWHGIPFKGFDRDDFRVQRRYDETWVASPSQRRLWIDRFGFDPGIVEATGYPRTDRLVRRDGNVDDVKLALGLDPARCGKLVMFAPTWQQDDSGRSVFPFGEPPEAFLSALSRVATEHGATVLLRTHLNSGDAGTALPRNVVAVPYARFPDTEALLLATDVLVCDWSSIAFDFLLLSRPTIFLDVPAPFAKGFSLDPSFRFGPVAGSVAATSARLAEFLASPQTYVAAFGARADAIREAVYGACADGNAAARCIARLRAATLRS